jgi:hypothetical protein
VINLDTETKQDLEQFRILLDNLAEDFEAFTVMWPRIQKVVHQLQEMPSKNPDKDGFFNVIYLYLNANQCKEGLRWLDQEIGRKMKQIEKKEGQTHETNKKNDVCTTSGS